MNGFEFDLSDESLKALKDVMSVVGIPARGEAVLNGLKNLREKMDELGPALNKVAPPRKTRRVKIPVAHDENGSAYVVAWSHAKTVKGHEEGEEEDYDEMKSQALDGLLSSEMGGEQAFVTWVEVDLPLPLEPLLKGDVILTEKHEEDEEE